jgi:hypothetical protein
VRANRVVFDSPIPDNNPRFCDREKDVAIETFIAQLVVKAFNMTVLPWGATLDVLGFDSGFLWPALDLLCNKLLSVVAADELGYSMSGEQLLEDLYDAGRCDSTVDLNRVAFPSVKIQHGENLDRSAVGSLVENKIVAPDMVTMRYYQKGLFAPRNAPSLLFKNF